LIRFNYKPDFPNNQMITDAQRANARDISNAIDAQTTSTKSARGLSDYIWAWGQFLTHDTDLTSDSSGAAVNGSAPIAINSSTDPLGPNPIPFVRDNFVTGGRSGTDRTPVNEVTSFIDASNVYGSDATRAAALRTGGGTGAKLITSANNLLPLNSAGLPNDNEGPVPSDQLFLAGDVRSNENSVLTSLHTLFVREHNRLVDRIAAQHPEYASEQQYQLARKLVGAEIEAITYNNFLPALLGNGQTVPKATGYAYSSGVSPVITTAYSDAAFRFGHSAVSSNLNLVNVDGTSAGNMLVRNAFFNPGLIQNDPAMIDKLLQGAATQRSEEIDTLVVDDLRNFLFGPPGAGGLDLASLNIQRGRDAGLPDYNELRNSFQLGNLTSFSQITSNAALAQALSTVYGGNINNVDAWVGMLAEDHVAGASVGPLLLAQIQNQFQRLRDGDRLFYRGNADGLYTSGTLNSDIASIIDLDHWTLRDVIEANTSITHLQSNVFFVSTPGDYNGDGLVDMADYVVWRKAAGTTNVWADGDGNGTVGTEDYNIWRAAFGAGAATGQSIAAAVPEPTTFVLAAIMLLSWRFMRTAKKRS
jgi:hypothetical protein